LIDIDSQLIYWQSWDTFLSFASVAISFPSGENARPVGHVRH